MNLVVDIGNTLVKLAVFDRGEIVFQRCVERLHPSMLEELFAAWPVRRAVVASTRGEVDEVADLLRPRVEYLLEFSSQTPVPIGNAYLTPETLGRDRLAAAVGATVLYPGRNVLIVDFGTAITFDFVSAEGEFLGGNISPGAATRFRALHHFTRKLPLCELIDREVFMGRDTVSAIEGGVVNGIVYEVEGYIRDLERKYDGLRIIFTGGDSNFFAKRVKKPIFATYDLVAYGLNRILEYNAK